MKRLAIILAAVIVLVTGILIVAPLFIPEELARARIAEQIEQWIGRPVTFTGEPAISFFPRPTVRLENVAIADGDGSDETFISVDELIGTVRLLPLLFGHVEVSSFRLERPTISLRVDESGATNWTFEGTLGDRVDEAFGVNEDTGNDVNEVALGRFRIIDGTVTYSEPGAPLAVISDVSLDIDWPVNGPGGNGQWLADMARRGLNISAALLQLSQLIAGRPSRGDFHRRLGDLIDIAFDGAVGRDDLDLHLRRRHRRRHGPAAPRHRLGGRRRSGAADTLANAPFRARRDGLGLFLPPRTRDRRLDGNAASGAFSVDFSDDPRQHRRNPGAQPAGPHALMPMRSSPRCRRRARIGRTS